MNRRTSLILSVTFIGALLSLGGCQQNTNPSGDQPPQSGQALDISKYDPGMPAENKLKLAQELTFKNIDQSMLAVTKMLPGLEKTNVLENEDGKNILKQGLEAWYYSKDLDKTFVAEGSNYSLITIFKGNQISDQDLAAAKSTAAANNLTAPAQEKPVMEKPSQQLEIK